jgi:hypothetical protein
VDHRSWFPNFISRAETKLKLRQIEAERLLGEVEKHLPIYCYAPGRAITFVSSVYFDTKDFLFYHRAKWFPHDNLKVRLKEYYYQLPAGYEVFPDCWIEVKRRLGESTAKVRFRIAKTLVGSLFAGEDLHEAIIASNQALEPSYLRRVYAEFLEVVKGRGLEAHSVTNYRRRTYQDEHDESLRVTFDDMIAYFRAPPELFNGTQALTRERLGPPAGFQRHTVVEIKVAKETPDWLKALLRTYPQSNFSKFLTSTQTLLVPESEELHADVDVHAAADEERRQALSAWSGLNQVAKDPFGPVGTEREPSPRKPS